jgi:DNA-binding transcriptional MerR regulator
MRIGYTNKQVAEITEIKPSSIAFYTNQGFVKPDIADPKGRGTTRRYSEENIFEFLLIKELGKYGIKLSTINFILSKTKKDIGIIAKVANMRHRKLPRIILVIYDPQDPQPENYPEVYIKSIIKTPFTDPKYPGLRKFKDEVKAMKQLSEITTKVVNFVFEADAVIHLENHHSVIAIDITRLWEKAFNA